MSLSFSNKLAIALTIAVIALTFILLIIFSKGTRRNSTDISNSFNKAEIPNDSTIINRDNDGNGIAGGCINGNCSDGKKNLPIYCVNTEQMAVSLSFDAAWGADDTIKILDILDKYNIKTTFFLTGTWVDTYPELVKEIHKRGHDIGNHSQNHKQMSKLSIPEQIAEIQCVTDKVRALTDYDMFLFRPPFGDYNDDLINTCYSLNYYPIEWSVDSLDWKDYGVNKIINTVTKHKALKSGAIILMHNGAKYTPDALESIITSLTSQGFSIVPISELIITDGFSMSSDGCQN